MIVLLLLVPGLLFSFVLDTHLSELAGEKAESECDDD